MVHVRYSSLSFVVMNHGTQLTNLVRPTYAVPYTHVPFTHSHTCKQIQIQMHIHIQTRLAMAAAASYNLPVIRYLDLDLYLATKAFNL